MHRYRPARADRRSVGDRLRPALPTGGATHTAPPTGAEDLNLVLADVHVLNRALRTYYDTTDIGLLEAYTDTVFRRIPRAQHSPGELP